MLKRSFCCIVACLLTIALGAVSPAETMIRKANIVEIDGTAEVRTPGSEKWVMAEVGMSLTQGDIIKTADGSIVVLLLEGVSGTANVELQAKSELQMAELFEDQEDNSQQTLLDLSIGRLLITSKKLRSEKSKFQVKTPTSIIGVRGTTFSVSVETEKVE